MKGFSLIECLVAISLFVVLSTCAMVFGQGVYSRNELQTFIDEIKSAIHFANHQSFIKGKTVYLESLSQTEDWSSGMGLYDLTAQGEKHLIHQWAWHHPQWRLTWSGFSSRQYISFSQQLHKAVANGRFKLIHRRTPQEKTLVLNRLGRIKAL